MPTKRPDQLPEGEDFDFEDILMVEKFPDSESRKLYKTQLRKLMKSALQMDPQRMGENAILGMQSKFDWVIEQMNKLSDSSIIDLSTYEDFNSDSKDKEKPFITPSVTVTPTPSSTPLLDPSIPRPSMTPTPTPTTSSKPLMMEKEITLKGRQNMIVILPELHRPERYGYTDWSIKPGQDNKNTFFNFFGYFPDTFKPSAMSEKLMSFTQIDQKSLRVEVGLFDSAGDLNSTQGLIKGSEIEFTIIYS